MESQTDLNIFIHDQIEALNQNSRNNLGEIINSNPSSVSNNFNQRQELIQEAQTQTENVITLHNQVVNNINSTFEEIKERVNDFKDEVIDQHTLPLWDQLPPDETSSVYSNLY